MDMKSGALIVLKLDLDQYGNYAGPGWCRVHGLKPPVAGKKKRSTETGPPSAAAIAKDFVCHHVLAKGPATVVPAAGTDPFGHCSSLPSEPNHPHSPPPRGSLPRPAPCHATPPVPR